MRRLFAFGDSLTAGYHHMGAAFAPWAPVLSKLLGDVTIDHVGLSGFTSAQMLNSMDDSAVEDVVPRVWPGYRQNLREHEYDVVLIMCGTNDLADKIRTRELIENIATLHEAAHAAGARSIAMTIPESKAAVHVDWLGQARLEANDAIRAWAGSRPAGQVSFVDTAALVPFSETSGRWEPDGLHMSRAGYEAFGRALAPLIAAFVMAAPPRTPAAPPAGPSPLSVDEMAAVEDAFKAVLPRRLATASDGDARRLEQGCASQR